MSAQAQHTHAQERQREVSEVMSEGEEWTSNCSTLEVKLKQLRQ